MSAGALEPRSGFAGHCSRKTTSLGAFALRGIEGLRERYPPSTVHGPA